MRTPAALPALLVIILATLAVPRGAAAASELHLLDTRLAVAGRLPPTKAALEAEPPRPPQWGTSTTLTCFLAAELGLGVAAGVAALSAVAFSNESDTTAIVGTVVFGVTAAALLPPLGVHLVAHGYGLQPSFPLAMFGNIVGIATSLLLTGLTDNPNALYALLVLPAAFATLGARLSVPDRSEDGVDDDSPADDDDPRYDRDVDDEFSRMLQQPPSRSPFRPSPRPVVAVPVLALRFF